MKVQTKQLEGVALDWAVAKCEYDELAALNIQFPDHAKHYPKVSPSTDWSQGGSIIEREHITVVCAEGDYSSELHGYTTFWVADYGRQTCETAYGPQGDNRGQHYQIPADSITGPTPLIAAMRYFVASKMGDEVEVPDELIKVNNA